MIEIDVHEPHEMVQLLRPIGNAQVTTLNTDGWPDYRWRTHDNRIKMVERKTWGELCSNPDRIEEQLLRHLTKHPSAELIFLLEGIAVQSDLDTLQELKQTKSGVWVKGYRHSKAASPRRIFPLLYRFSEYMQVVQTTTLTETALMLCAMYESDQKDNHETFKRNIKLVEFNTDPRVTSLMGSAPGLGNKRATDIIAATGTFWNFASAGFVGDVAIKDWRELTKIAGIGETTVRNVLRGYGRPDV